MTKLTRSVKCPECQGDLWDAYGNTAECSNCGHERPYHRRSTRDDSVTRSQKYAAQRIRRYFDGSKFSGTGKPTKVVSKWETELQEGTGLYYVNIETDTGNIHLLDGGHFAIGRRGGIRVLSSYKMSKTRKDDLKHLAKIVGGKVGW